MPRRPPPTPLEDALGHRFRDPGLRDLALTHRSFANEQEMVEHNERLEFLGDAVLDLVTVEWLYREHPELPEGELARYKSRLVSARTLAGWAAELDLGRALRLGVGESRSGGRAKKSLLEDAMEALLGAVYLDGGHEAARRVLVPRLEAALAAERAAPTAGIVAGDAKTALQEVVQARGWPLPEYLLLAEEGPDHAKRFTVEVRLRHRPVGRGEGRSKKDAEKAAAAAALEAFAAAESVAAGGGEPMGAVAPHEGDSARLGDDGG